MGFVSEVRNSGELPYLHLDGGGAAIRLATVEYLLGLRALAREHHGCAQQERADADDDARDRRGGLRGDASAGGRPRRQHVSDEAAAVHAGGELNH